MLERKKHLELKKHVATIHSTNKLSLLERKISNALLFNAYDDLLKKEEHQIHIGSLCRLIGYNSNDHKIIKKALIELLSTVLEWNLVDGQKLNGSDMGIWNASSIIADASIDGAICTYSYSNKMKKLLYYPEFYGRLNMAVQAKFQSNYGLALYENCIRFQDIEQTPWFDIVKFRKLMGVEENKYKIFRDFKHRVLDKAVEEVNKYSSIAVDTQLRRQNRRVVAIQFLIKRMENIALIDNSAIFSAQEKLADVLKEKFGISKKQIAEVLSSYEEDYIREKISLIESSPSFKTGKINNLARFLLCALKDDYQVIKSSRSKVEKVNDQKNKVDDEVKRQKQVMEKNKKAYNVYCSQVIDRVIENLDTSTKKQLMSTFYQFAEKPINTVLTLQRCKYTKETVLQSPQIKVLLRQFARKKMAERLVEIRPFEEFLKGIHDEPSK